MKMGEAEWRDKLRISMAKMQMALVSMQQDCRHLAEFDDKYKFGMVAADSLCRMAEDLYKPYELDIYFGEDDIDGDQVDGRV